jgi:hypothetical protein
MESQPIELINVDKESNYTTPYQFIIKNKSDKPQEAVLFGYGKFINSVNYGSNYSIEIIPTAPNICYIESLSESAFYPFTIGMIRIESKQGNAKISKIEMDFIKKSGKGHEEMRPCIVSEHINDDNEDGCVNIDACFNINSKSHIALIIPENSEFIFSVYPSNKETSAIDVSVTEKTSNASPLPYSLKFENVTSETLKCIIFGTKRYLSEKNFGSVVGVNLISNINRVTYTELLQQAECQPFTTSKIKIQSFDNPKQLENDILVKECDTDEEIGHIYSKTFFNEKTKTTLDVIIELRISGDNYIEFDVLPNTSGIIYFYPKPKNRI